MVQEGHQVTFLLRVIRVISGQSEEIKTSHSNYSDNDLSPADRQAERMIQKDMLLVSLQAKPWARRRRGQSEP